jgi:hypothetical protein
MKSTADIRLKTESMEMQFEWRDFDGDDCFADFHINVVAQNDIRRFDFGPSVIYGLRKLRKFFRDANQKEAGLGFRYPDIRCCDLHRVEDGYSVAIRFEGSGLNEEFVIKHPNVEIDDRFLTEYYDA